MTIYAFNREFSFLSNFSWVPGGVYGYPTVEHYFQAMKTEDKDLRCKIKSCNRPSQAKAMGRNLTLRDNWDEIKDEVMLKGLRAKFRPGTDLANKLLATGDHQLQEGNYWHDNYWGVCSCGNKDKKHQRCAQGGLNKLGILLMQVREELKTV